MTITKHILNNDTVSFTLNALNYYQPGVPAARAHCFCNTVTQDDWQACDQKFHLQDQA